MRIRTGKQGTCNTGFRNKTMWADSKRGGAGNDSRRCNVGINGTEAWDLCPFSDKDAIPPTPTGLGQLLGISGMLFSRSSHLHTAPLSPRGCSWGLWCPLHIHAPPALAQSSHTSTSETEDKARLQGTSPRQWGAWALELDSQPGVILYHLLHNPGQVTG